MGIGEGGVGEGGAVEVMCCYGPMGDVLNSKQVRSRL